MPASRSAHSPPTASVRRTRTGGTRSAGSPAIKSAAASSCSADTLEKLRAAGADALEVDVTDQASVLQALGAVATKQRKPEYHGRRAVTHQQKLGA